MKNLCFLFIIFMILTSCATYKKGDLILFIEPSIGFVSDSVTEMADSTKNVTENETNSSKNTNEKESMEGPDFSFRLLVDYYFTNWFSLCAGLGFSGNNPQAKDVSSIGSYSTYSLTVPLGLRFFVPLYVGDEPCFTFGVGITANLPIDAYPSLYWVAYEEADRTINVNPYLGYYLDMGFTYEIFEIIFRGQLAFKNIESALKDDKISMEVYGGTFSCVLRVPIRLGNYPIGGNY